MEISNVVAAARVAQSVWSERTSLKERGQVSKSFASQIAKNARGLHEALKTPQRCDYRETLSAELFPLADAAKWLFKSAQKLLAARTVCGPGRPLFMRGLRSVMHREPMGVVLIIGTWNYPVFLVGTQILQAIVAGNSVLVKPAQGCEAVTQLLVDLLVQSGMDKGLCTVLGEAPENASAAIAAGVDLIVLTGSSETGRKVLEQASKTLTPAIMELSGCDAVLVLESADLKRVVDGLLFGLRLNGGATCMAPRRVFVPQKRLDELKTLLRSRLHEVPNTFIDPRTIARVVSLVKDSPYKLLAPEPQIDSPQVDPLGTAQLLEKTLEAGRPAVFTDATIDFPLTACDIFAPVLTILSFINLKEVVSSINGCKYGLTASIFGDERLADAIALQLGVGMVIINDLIAPTADPRLPFGGIGESGFGVTRGVEGLMQMTRPKVVSVNRAGWLPHLDRPQDRDAPLLDGILQWCHAGDAWRSFCGLVDAIKAIASQSKSKSDKNES